MQRSLTSTQEFTPDAVGPGSSVEASALLERLSALEDENQRLAARVAALESQPRSAEAARVPAGERAGSPELRDELERELASALETGATLRRVLEEDPGFLEERVAETLEKVRLDERVAKVQAYQDKRLAQLDADVERYTEKLELDTYQAEELRAALLAQHDREAALTLLWEQGTPDEVLGEQKQADGAAFSADLGAFLSEQQLETFWATSTGK